MKNQRTCVVCRETKEKSAMFRIVKNKNGEIKISESPKDQGRGAYICKKSDCIDKAEKKKALNYAFKQEVPNVIYENLKNSL